MSEYDMPRLRYSDRPMPWDEPSRLTFYGVDPGEYGNRQREERRAAAERVDADRGAEETP